MNLREGKLEDGYAPFLKGHCLYTFNAFLCAFFLTLQLTKQN